MGYRVSIRPVSTVVLCDRLPDPDDPVSGPGAQSPGVPGEGPTEGQIGSKSKGGEGATRDHDPGGLGRRSREGGCQPEGPRPVTGPVPAKTGRQNRTSGPPGTPRPESGQRVLVPLPPRWRKALRDKVTDSRVDPTRDTGDTPGLWTFVDQEGLPRGPIVPDLSLGPSTNEQPPAQM